MSLDHVALLPAYLAAGTAVIVLLADVLVGARAAVLGTAAAGAAATAVAAAVVGAGDTRTSMCAALAGDCSYVMTPLAGAVGVLFALLTLAVLALSAPILRPGGPPAEPALAEPARLAGAHSSPPAGEYCFLLACSMTGGVVLGAAGDLITLIVALETLTLPLYLLVGLRRTVASAEGAVTFFVVSVVATAVSLLGAALLYAATGALHLRSIGDVFGRDAAMVDQPLTVVAAALLVAGLAFKVAAVPFHAWAPAAYDGAPLPVAAYLSTASKLGGVVALLYVWRDALPPATTGPVLAVLAALTMTVGNLVALRQTRMVRLLAWSSVAQAGYIIAPLGAAAMAAGRDEDALRVAAAATVAYAIFFVVMELGAFATVIALRPAGAGAGIDGGEIADYRGAARRHPWLGAALVLALIGLAGLPPGLAGLFAKVTVVRSLLDGGAGWLAVVVALNAVVGLAYYLRVAASLYAAGPEPGGAPGRVPRLVAVTVAVVTVAAIVIGFAPQLVLDAADLAGR
jgi:NADH-quinone oxidoreductase subunit N